MAAKATMDTIQFTPYTALIGGALIGLSTTFLFYFNGQLSGVSGIASGLIDRDVDRVIWRLLFLIGLIVGALAYQAFMPQVANIAVTDSIPILVAGGLLVGFSTRMANGCTSGHGICGISLISLPSFVATACFLSSAIITVWVVRHGWGS